MIIITFKSKFASNVDNWFFVQSSYCNDTYASAVGVNKQYVDTYLPKLFQSNLLCAGHESSEQGSCKGDSGGPLMQNKVGKQTSSNSKKVIFPFFATEHFNSGENHPFSCILQ